jgi:hypothetical protein
MIIIQRAVLAHLAHPRICLKGVPETKKILSQNREYPGGDPSTESPWNIRCVICSDKESPSRNVRNSYTKNTLF